MEYEKKCKIMMGEKEVSPQGHKVTMIYDLRLLIFDF